MKVALHSLFVLSFSLFGAELKVVKIDEIHIRGELGSHESSWLAYILDQDGHDVVEIGGQLKSGTIFTGKAVSQWSIGQKKLEIIYKDGKRDGLETSWCQNGQKSGEGNWKDGKRQGSQTRWHQNGQKKAVVNNNKEGKLDGLSIEWYENGQKKKEENHKVNELMSAVVWKPNGEKCLETNLKDGKGVYVEYKEDGTVRYKSKTKSPPAQTR